MPPTAHLLDPTVTVDELYAIDTNLRLGFTYFRTMLERYDGDVWLALTAYYRGPKATDYLVAQSHPRIAGVFQHEYAYQILSGVY
jgi:soluble lytic murein transglycosylase-like protein